MCGRNITAEYQWQQTTYCNIYSCMYTAFIPNTVIEFKTFVIRFAPTTAVLGQGTPFAHVDIAR